MDGIKLKVFEKAINGLKLLNLKYAVIDDNGTKHGDLEVIHKIKSRSRYPYGCLLYTSPSPRDQA